MNSQVSKRIVAAGLAAGALSLLRQQGASADTPFTSFPFPATGASTLRTMPERLAEIVNVKDFGAVGNGTTNDTAAIQAAFDAAYGTSTAPNGSSGFANRTVFFPPGNYMTTAPLILHSLEGAHIMGSGQTATQIKNVTLASTVIKTNGCARTVFEHLTLIAGGTGSIAFDLDWNGTGPVALNANTFSNVGFSAEIGTSVGTSGYMGSENLFMSCTWASCGGQGLVTRNFNALDQTIIGGSCWGCGSGFKVLTGSIQLIMNVGFAANNYDIDIQSNCVNAIIGCRTESPNFINGAGGTFSIIACDQQAGSNGAFIDNLNGSCLISSCQSKAGSIKGYHGPLDIRASDFGRSDFLSGYNGPVATSWHRDLRQSQTANLTIKRAFSGMQYDNIGATSPVNFILPAMNDQDESKKGTKFGFYVATAQTLNVMSQNNMTIRIAGSVSAANGRIASSTVGSYVEIECIDGGRIGNTPVDATMWVAKSSVGNWTVT
jgi:hypothetical protein